VACPVSQSAPHKTCVRAGVSPVATLEGDLAGLQQGAYNCVWSPEPWLVFGNYSAAGGA
jgi:hypothetical protein